MTPKKSTLWIVVFSLCLTGCAHFANTKKTPAQALPVAKNKQQSWQQYYKDLQAINSWYFKAKLGITTENQANSITLDWMQKNPKRYDIYLSGPLGQTLAKIESNRNGATLIVPNKKVRHTRTTEELVSQNMNWNLPVSQLYYWLRGIPSPTEGSAITFNRYGLIKQLTQNMWEVQYKEYGQFQGHWLPTKIVAFFPRANVILKLIIKDWQIK